jgi:nucleotide-binding universal stress UspA family protein
MYEHLLVALDGSPAAERVLPHAEALATAFHSTVTLLRSTISTEMFLAETAGGDTTVGQVAPTLDPTPVLEADRSAAVEYLNGIAARLRQRNLSVNVEHPQGPASKVIVERAAALGVSLILMTTHGRGGLGRMVFGSVADSVLRHASCPVLVVRVSDAEAETATRL